MSKFFRVALIAATAMVSTAAQADVHWYITGTFDDGATLSGSFDINQYGFLGDRDLTITGGTLFPVGNSYNFSNTSPSNNDFDVGLYQNSYTNALTLHFADNLQVGSLSNALLGTSYECRDDSGCPAETTGTYHYLTSGFASINPISNVPEPASWAMMIVGFGVAGTAMRRAKVRTVTYTA